MKFIIGFIDNNFNALHEILKE